MDLVIYILDVNNTNSPSIIHLSIYNEYIYLKIENVRNVVSSTMCITYGQTFNHSKCTEAGWCQVRKKNFRRPTL